MTRHLSWPFSFSGKRPRVKGPITDGQTDFALVCPAFCGARAKGTVRWGLGNNFPTLMFAERSEIYPLTKLP